MRRDTAGILVMSSGPRESGIGCRRRRVAIALAAIALFGSVGQTGCLAAEAPGRGAAPKLPPTLASVFVLSDSAMARESATSLRPPAVISRGIEGHPTVTLWDELHAPPQISNGAGGNVTLSVTVK